MNANRQEILSLVLSSENHPTADDIYFELKSQGKKVTLSTVYNNLSALCREGEIAKVSFNGKTDRFDKIARHDHLICSMCGDVKDVYLPDMRADIESECGEKIEGYELKIMYVCPKCQKAKSGAYTEAR